MNQYEVIVAEITTWKVTVEAPNAADAVDAVMTYGEGDWSMINEEEYDLVDVEKL